MKKRIALALTMALAAAMPAVAPAANTATFEGFSRVRGITTNLTLGRNQDPDQLVDWRTRLGINLAINEYVKAVYWAEIDYQFGDAAYGTGTRNDGGGLGADVVNLETARLYVEAKFPGTPITATIGIMNFTDNWDLMFLNAHTAGVKLNVKAGMADVTAAWFKFVEEKSGNVNGPGGSRAEDDTDLYVGSLALMPTKNLKLGGDLWYYKGQGSTGAAIGGFPNIPGANFGVPAFVTPAGWAPVTLRHADLYYAGLNATFTTPMFNVTGWGLYNFGTIKYKGGIVNNAAGKPVADTSDKETDVRGYAGTVKATVTMAGADVGVRGIYMSSLGDKMESKIGSVYIPWGGGEATPFLREGFMLMLFDGGQTTYPGQGGFAWNAATTGYGLQALTLTGGYVPPTNKNFYFRGSLGYFSASSGAYGMVGGERLGKVYGTEAAGHIGYKFCNGAFDLSLNGAYAVLGDFYSNTVDATVAPSATSGTQRFAVQHYRDPKTGNLTGTPNGEDPDNPWIVTLMMVVPF